MQLGIVTKELFVNIDRKVEVGERSGVFVCELKNDGHFALVVDLLYPFELDPGKFLEPQTKMILNIFHLRFQIYFFVNIINH
jgi:hypothetical protein